VFSKCPGVREPEWLLAPKSAQYQVLHRRLRMAMRGRIDFASIASRF